MSDNFWIKHNLGTFQQPYIFQQNRNRQTPVIAQKVGTVPAIARQPSTYQHRVPTTYRNPVSAQEPNIRSAQEPNIRSAQEPNIRSAQEPNIRSGQTPFTYNFRSPFTYRNPVSYQLPFTYQYRSPFTYRNPVSYQLPFTYNYRSPGTYRNPVNRQTSFTFNIQTTVPYSYQSPYIFNMWGSPSAPSTNVAYIFNKDTESLSSNTAVAATTVNIRHLVANKRIDFFFINTVDGGPGSTHTTDQESVFYTGTLNNLEARFVFNTMDLTRDDDEGNGDAVIGQAFDTSGQINAISVSSDGTSVTGATTVNSLNSNVGQNVTFNSPWGNIGIDNNIDKSAMLYVSARGTGNLYDAGTYAQISSGGVGTLAIQLRANQDNNDIVTLYTRTGTFDLAVYSFEDDTS